MSCLIVVAESRELCARDGYGSSLFSGAARVLTTENVAFLGAAETHSKTLLGPPDRCVFRNALGCELEKIMVYLFSVNDVLCVSGAERGISWKGLNAGELVLFLRAARSLIYSPTPENAAGAVPPDHVAIGHACT